MEKKYFSGFTLIELLVAVSIIAILILLIISTVLSQIDKGNDAKRKSDLDRIKIAVEEYEKDYNCYPPPGKMKICGSDQSIAIYPYLNNVPCDPVTHAVYPYEPDPDTLSCPVWFRAYTALQNTKDLAIMKDIGPGGAYNYYVSSPNAPVPTRGAAVYGCIHGVCREVYPDENGRYCDPNYPDKGCSGQCKEHSECVAPP